MKKVKLTGSQMDVLGMAQQQVQQAQEVLRAKLGMVLSEHGLPVTSPVEKIEDGHLIIADPPEDEAKEE